MRNNREKTKNRPVTTNIFIACEGEQTEVNYFKSFKFTGKPFMVIVKGYSQNCVALIKKAIAVRKYALPLVYTEFYVVFDRDETASNQFNDAICLCKSNDMIPIWSNESFELWFLLHFKIPSSVSSRHDYANELNDLLAYGYEKNRSGLRDLIKDHELIAINHAKSLEDDHQKNGIYNSCNQKPCTKVHHLVQRLISIEAQP